MPGFTHVITRGYRDSAGSTVSSTESISADSERNFDASVAPSTTRQEIDLALTRANLKSMWFYATFALELLAQAAATTAVEGTTNTNAVDAQINITSHGYSVGQRIHILGITGSTNLNGFYYVKTVVDADHFKISLTSGGSAVQGNGAAYVSGGTVQKLDTISLAAGQSLVWNLSIDGLSALPFTANTDAFYVTNASGTDTAVLKIRALADQTP